MKLIILPLIAISLSGCASVKINGYEVSSEAQLVGMVGAIAVGTMIYSLSDDGNPEAGPNPKTNPGEIVCVINIETGACR
jgi:hypothetical protein